MRVVAYIPVKAHSERVPRKNFALVDGKPLYQRVVHTVLASGVIDRVVVDTDSDEVLEWCAIGGSGKMVLGVQRWDAEKVSHWNGSQMMARFRDRVGDGYADVWLHTYATAVHLQPETVCKGVRVLEEQPFFDSVVSARRVEEFFLWVGNKPLYDLAHFGRTQDWPDFVWAETNSLYLVRDAALKAYRARVGRRPYPLFVSEEEGMDIDWPEDLQKVKGRYTLDEIEAWWASRYFEDDERTGGDVDAMRSMLRDKDLGLAAYKGGHPRAVAGTLDRPCSPSKDRP